MRPCRHADWIAQPMRNCYHFHCRECTIIVSHELKTNRWRVSRDPDRIDVVDTAELQFALSALDQWMTSREETYGHDIFSHPTVEIG